MKQPAPGRILFLDTEFTTLDKRRRQVWELAVIVRDPGMDDVEYEWQIRPDLTDAAPDALRIGRYYQRCRVFDKTVGTAVTVVAGTRFPELRAGTEIDLEHGRLTTAAAVAAQFARLADGAYIVGAVPSADETALDIFLPQHGQVLTTHYRIQCVETLVHGFLLGRRAERAHMPVVPPPPWDPKVMSELVGVPVPGADVAHRALVDARWVRDMWDAVHLEYRRR